jgi:hypothetical protein
VTFPALDLVVNCAAVRNAIFRCAGRTPEIHRFSRFFGFKKVGERLEVLDDVFTLLFAQRRPSRHRGTGHATLEDAVNIGVRR